VRNKIDFAGAGAMEIMRPKPYRMRTRPYDTSI
jgi:hypothetical protein